MDPFDLILAGKYEKAVSEYSKNENKLCAPEFCNRGLAYLNLKQYELALDDFMEAEQRRNQELPERGDGYLKMAGLAKWLMGKEEDAVDLWLQILRDHQKGNISFSDSAGGVEIGLLLWFATSFEKFSSQREDVTNYLLKKSMSTKIRSWPGPIALYVLSQIGGQDLLKEAGVVRELKNRRMCQSHFYIAIQDLVNGQQKDGLGHIKSTINYGQKSFLENEYYLAKHELARIEGTNK